MCGKFRLHSAGQPRRVRCGAATEGLCRVPQTPTQEMRAAQLTEALHTLNVVTKKKRKQDPLKRVLSAVPP